MQTGDDSGVPRRPHRRGRILALVVLLLVVGGVALAVLSRPLLTAKREADRAQSDLKLAKTELSQQHLAKARSYIADARTHVDTAHRDAHGLGADVVVRRTGGRGCRRRRATPHRRARRDDHGRRDRCRDLPDGVRPELPSGQRPADRPQGPAEGGRPDRPDRHPPRCGDGRCQRGSGQHPDRGRRGEPCPRLGARVPAARAGQLRQGRAAGGVAAVDPGLRRPTHLPARDAQPGRAARTPAAVRCRSPRCTSTTAGPRSGRA